MFRFCAPRLTAVLICLGVFAGAPAAWAAEVDCDRVYCFQPEDFSQEETLTGICITDLPEQGQMLLGSRVLRAGDILTAQQVAQMTFVPALTEQDQAAQVGYLPIYEGRVAPAAAMTIGIRGRENQPPAAEDSALETYKNLPNTGRLKVSDPEGQAMTYALVRPPKRGSVTIQADGSFTYTPKKNKVGVDSFTYTATDEAGKTSREATVTITILKPSDAAQYTDTQGRACRFAAEWMRHTGIFQGETVAEHTCFNPDRAVTRGEFVTMLVKALDIPTDQELACTGYEDDIPQWLQPYLAAAVRSGLTAGLPEQHTFGPDIPITGAEASVMLRNALGLTEQAAGEGSDTVPAWAQGSLSALDSQGITLEPEAVLTRGQSAQVLYQASRLAARNLL